MSIYLKRFKKRWKREDSKVHPILHILIPDPIKMGTYNKGHHEWKSLIEI
jgi:hypothetical protein